MQLWIKILVSVGVLLAATSVARRFPSVAGLIGVMPLAGAMVLAFVYLENAGEPKLMRGFVKGALWGMLPSLLFYLAAYWCLEQEYPLWMILAVSFGVWFAAALGHFWLLGG